MAISVLKPKAQRIAPPKAAANYRGLLQLLYQMSGKQTVADFARRCGKQPGNMANYLNGNLSPGRRFVESCAAAMFSPSFNAITIMEVEPIPLRQVGIPKKPGVYVIYDSAARVLYVGKATNFRTEVWQTLDRAIPVPLRLGPKLVKSRPTLRALARYLSLYEMGNPGLRHDIEVLLLRVFVNQTHNSNIGSFRA